MILVFDKGDYRYPLPEDPTAFDVIRYLDQEDQYFEVTNSMVEAAKCVLECDPDERIVTILKNEYSGVTGKFPITDFEDIINQFITEMQ